MRVKNLKFKNTSYGITDENALPILKNEEKSILLTTGKYLDSTVKDEALFLDEESKIQKFHTEISGSTYTSYTTQATSTSRTGYSIFERKGYLYYIPYSNKTTALYMYRWDGNSTFSSVKALGIEGESGYFNWDGKDNIVGFYGSYSNGNVLVSHFEDSSATSKIKDFVKPPELANFRANHSAILYGNGIFLIGGANNKFALSNDGGKTWRVVTGLGQDTHIYTLAFLNGQFIFTTDLGSKIYVSEDGEHWTQKVYPNNTYVNNIVYTQGEYLAFTNGNSYKMFSSPDLINWTEKVSPDGYWSGPLLSIGPTVYALTSSAVYYTNDIGTTWTKITTENTANGVAVFSEEKQAIFGLHYYYAYRPARWNITTTRSYTLNQVAYNKSNMDTLLAAKQGTLIAGTGINIANNVISATSGETSLTDIAQAGNNITFTNVPITDYTKVGTDVTVTSNGVASGFNSSSYLQKTGLWNSVGGKNNFIFVTKVRITTAGDYYPFVQGSSTVQDNNQFMIGFTSSKIWVEIAIGGTAQWANCSLPAVNTDFWLKVDYSNSRGRFDIYLSSDGTSWGSSVGGVTATGNMDTSTAPAFSIGGASILPSSGTAFTGGSIDLSETYVSVDGNIIWRAFEQTNKTSINASAPIVDQTYNALSVNAQSGVAVKSAIDNAIASIYKPAGSSTFASLPALSPSIEGYVYNVSDAFITTSDFVEGLGKNYPAGTNIVCIDIGSSTYKWDVLAGFVDLSSYVQNTATGSGSLTIGGTAATDTQAVNIGIGSSAYQSGVAVGYNASTTTVTGVAIGNAARTDGSLSVAIGRSAVAAANNTIQIGQGTNNTANTMQVAFGKTSYVLMDAQHKIPTDRYIPLTGATVSTAGITGSVPAPAAGDNEKFLRGDGTWAEAGGGSSIQKITENNTALTSDGTVCTWVIMHNLETKDVNVNVYNISTGNEPICDINHTSANTVTVTFNSTIDIAADTYRAVIIG